LVRDSEGRPDYWYAIIEDVTERRRAAEAVQAQADTFKALNEVAVAAAGVLEPAELARIAAERARDLLGAGGGSLTWFDEQRQGLRVLADTEVEFDPELVRPISKTGAQGQAWRTGMPVAIEDYHSWDKRIPSEVGRVKSALVVPLQVRQRRIGTLAVNYHQARTFHADDLQLLSLLAAEVAPSLEAARLHEDLVASTRSIRAIFDTAPVGIARLDVRLDILGLNRRAEELTGHHSSELVGRSLAESLIGANDLEAPVQDLLAGRGDKLRFERPIRRKGGEAFLADLTLTAVRNPSGEAEFVYAMFDDITERKHAEEALRGSEGRKAAIVESALDCIIAADHEGRIIEFNPAAERTFGHRRGDVLGKGIWETIVPPPLRARHLEELKGSAVPERKVVGRRIETTGLKADGTEFPIELSVAAYQQEGKTMFSVSIRDLTERAHMETMRQESEAKSRFVASMSHELRTPLNSILGFSQLLAGAGTGDLNERQQRYVGHIESSGRHLLALINDVLDLSKVAAGQMEVELEPIELQPLLEEAINQLRPQADAKPLDLLLDTCPPLWIRADRRRFLQVMLNLLSNSIKFTPAGGLVRVQATRAGRSAEIAVVDTGVGIPPAEQERIFEEFTQVERTSSESAEGTGLGLALSKRLLGLMRGTIRVESAVGSGSVFTVTIPRVRPGEVADSRPLLLVVAADGTSEDSSLLTQLEAGPYRVIATGTVREAAVIARRRRVVGIIIGESLKASDEDWLREALRDHPRTHSLPILSAAVALHPGVLIRG
jgi:PAS domain S-box-containing protein